MAIVQETDPNSINVVKAEKLKAIKNETCGKRRNLRPSLRGERFNDIDNDNGNGNHNGDGDEVESGPMSGRQRRKSVFVQLWIYVKESWLGAMSGTGKMSSKFISQKVYYVKWIIGLNLRKLDFF